MRLYRDGCKIGHPCMSKWNVYRKWHNLSPKAEPIPFFPLSHRTLQAHKYDPMALWLVMTFTSFCWNFLHVSKPLLPSGQPLCKEPMLSYNNWAFFLMLLSKGLSSDTAHPSSVFAHHYKSQSSWVWTCSGQFVTLRCTDAVYSWYSEQ